MHSETPPEKPAATQDSEDFPVQQARRIVADLFDRRSWIYWVDFLASITLAYGLAWIYFTAPAWSAAQVLSLVGSGLLLFRAGIFIHEISHMQPGEMTLFKVVWNLLMGIPLLMPSSFYHNHVDHHGKQYFGTPEDGEYLPLGLGPATELLRYVAQAPLLPILVVGRFLITPLTYLHPRLRHWAVERASALVANPYYRYHSTSNLPGFIVWAEWAGFAWLCVVGVLLWQGIITWRHIGLFYLLMTFTLGVNWLRNLAAHHYLNDGDPMTLSGQLRDSINIVGQHWLTVPMFPVGLRYHALHHLFPAMPYHQMGRAHRRLLAQLPADSAYHQVNYPSFWSAAR